MDLADEDELAGDVQAPGAARARRGRRGRAGGRRPRRPAGRRRGAGASCAAATSPCSSSRTRSTTARARSGRRVLRRSGSASRCRSPPPRASAPGTCSTGSSTRSATAAGAEDEDARPGRADRASERRQVLAGQRLLGAERVIVSDLAGTTRDAIDTELEVEGRRSSWWTPPGCAAAPRSPARSTTTPSCAPSGPPSAPTWRSWSATPPRA